MRKVLVFISLATLPFSMVLGNQTSDLTLPKIQVLPLKDSQSDRQYELYIKLPEKYSSNKDKHYPVIYYTDALWHVEMLSSTTEFLMEDVILVGISWQKNIDNKLIEDAGEHVSRYRDYSTKPSSDPKRQAKYQFGQAQHHLDFIRNQVIKTIENNYRADPSERSYFGYSLGGEFGAYVLLKQPNTFKNYILGSPSLKGDITQLNKLASKASFQQEKFTANVFISYGSLEKELGEHAEKLIALLKSTNKKHISVHNVVIKGTHQTAFPLTGVRSVTWLSNLTKEEE